jgi:F420-non-reducing hydrogenase iron-sulfur subunit
VKHIRALLVDIGLEPERVRMANVSSAMGEQFAALAREVEDHIRTLGASPLRHSRAGTPDEAGQERKG